MHESPSTDLTHGILGSPMTAHLRESLGLQREDPGWIMRAETGRTQPGTLPEDCEEAQEEAYAEATSEVELERPEAELPLNSEVSDGEMSFPVFTLDPETSE